MVWFLWLFNILIIGISCKFLVPSMNFTLKMDQVFIMIHWLQINRECQDNCKDVQFLGDRLFGQLNFVLWIFIFVGP